MLNKYYFQRVFVIGFGATVDYYAKTLEERVLTAFNNTSAEADQVVQETLDRLGSSLNPEWYDESSYFESAQDAGVEFYMMAEGIKQGLLNLFSAGLYHLFEQWFFKFHRRELLYWEEQHDSSKINWKFAKDRLQNDYGINIDSFSTSIKINELRLIANTVKHADGVSCSELKTIRPEFFVAPSQELDQTALDWVPRCQVVTPLSGDDVYISIDEFKKYVEVVKAFWNELDVELDKIRHQPDQ